MDIYSDAQRCKTSGIIMIGVRIGCPCGCEPEIGAIKSKDWFKGLHGEQEAIRHLFTPATDLIEEELTSSREADICELKLHLKCLKEKACKPN